MKISAICHAFLFSLLAIMPTAAEQTEEAYEGSYIRRPTLVVSDMDKCLYLYRDILGFRLGSLKDDPKDSNVFEAFNIPTEARALHATLDSDSEKRTLSLVEYADLPAIDARNETRRAAVLVNANGRFDDIKSSLEDGGYHFFSPHALGPNGIELGFIDPDGHLILIYDINYNKEELKQ